MSTTLLRHYSDIVSDIPSGSIYWIYIYIHIFSDILSDIFLAFCLTFSLASGWGLVWQWPLSSRLKSGSELAVEVRHCSLRSGARGWCPAVPTEIWSSRLRSGSAHWDLELAVEVRQCPLRSGARGWGGGGGCRGGRRQDAPLIKSKDLHLAGGEQQ